MILTSEEATTYLATEYLLLFIFLEFEKVGMLRVLAFAF